MRVAVVGFGTGSGREYSAWESSQSGAAKHGIDMRMVDVRLNGKARKERKVRAKWRRNEVHKVLLLLMW